MEEEENHIEPENQTTCPNTRAGHVWLWNKEQDQYECDECGVLEGNQE